MLSTRSRAFLGLTIVAAIAGSAILVDKQTATSSSHANTLLRQAEQCLRSEGLDIVVPRVAGPAVTSVDPTSWFEAFRPPSTAIFVLFFANHRAASYALTREIAFVQSSTKELNKLHPPSERLPIPSTSSLIRTDWVTGPVLYWDAGSSLGRLAQPTTVRRCLQA
jgi:hypothetical protein